MLAPPLCRPGATSARHNGAAARGAGPFGDNGIRGAVTAPRCRWRQRQNAARVDWQVVAKTGLTAGGIADLVDESELGDPDVVLMSVGANDTKDLHTTARFRRELADLLDLIRERAPRAQILVLGAAPMQILPALQGAIGRGCTRHSPSWP